MYLLQNNQSEPFSKMNIFTYKIPIFPKILVKSVMTFFVNIFIEIDIKIFTENKALITWKKKDKSTILPKIQAKTPWKSPLTLCKQKINIFFRATFPLLIRSISEMDFFVCFLSIFLSEFSLYLTDQSCNKRGAENPPACVRACLIFLLLLLVWLVCVRDSIFWIWFEDREIV